MSNAIIKFFQDLLGLGKDESEKYEVDDLGPAKPVTEVSVDGSIAGRDYVDLGLSVRWATRNVGATSITDDGYKFAWGETQTKKVYSEQTSLTYKKKMNDIAGDPRYDAARANWGEPWRMPTRKEFEELINSC